MPALSEKIVHLHPELEQYLVDELDPQDLSECLINLVRGGLSAHEHAFHFPQLSKEAFLAFIGEAWDAGEHQLKISRCEVEGGYNNQYGISFSLAASVALFGERKGLLPKKD